MDALATRGGTRRGDADADGGRLRRDPARVGRAPLDLRGIDWVIIGGESGPKARPFHLSNAYELAHACRTAGVATFVKQLGARPMQWSGARDVRDHIPYPLLDRKGGDMAEWPADLRIREFPASVAVPA